MNTGPTCTQCRHAAPEPSGQNIGKRVCKRFPPALLSLLTPNGPQVIGTRPIVEATDSCGEFSPIISS